MLPKAGAQNTEIVKNQEAQNTTFPCPGAYVRSVLPEYTSETYSQRPCCCKPCCCSTSLLSFLVDLTAGQEHRKEKLSKTNKHRTQRCLVLEHIRLPSGRPDGRLDAQTAVKKLKRPSGRPDGRLDAQTAA